MKQPSHFAINRRRLLQLASVTATATALPSLYAQTWPTRPLHIVVPFPPGGTTDYVTRLVGGEVGRDLGQTVVIDNKPGAGTVIGVDAVAKAAPDGYTLVCVANSFAINETLLKSLPYDGAKDLRPVALMGLSEHVLAATPSLGVKNLAQLAAYSKSHPGQLSYASFGTGTSAHLAGEMLRTQLGLDMVHVPFKGQAPALTALLGGQVSVMFGNWPEFRSHIEDGKLVALGMATLKRSIDAPNIPTLAEQGTPIESNSWNGLLAPAATPDAIVKSLNEAVNKALRAPNVVAAFKKGGIVAQGGSPQDFATFLRSEVAKYAKVIHESNITV